jgi:prepilin-type N-terminal cleavage/methylation domain-containing protein
MHNRKAFTLIELLVVIGIIALLIVLIVGTLGFADNEAIYRGRLIRDWIDIYGEYNSLTRNEAAEVLLEMGQAAVPHLIEALHDEEVQVRKGAVMLLRKFGPLAKDALPGLIDTTRDTNHWMRIYAIQALGSIGPSAEAAKPVLIEFLKGPHNEAHLEAACALAKIEPGSEEAITGFFQVFRKNNGGNRAERAFAEMGPVAIPYLVAALKDENPAVRGCASSTLSRIGEPAVPVLQKALSDPDDEVRRWAASALGEIDWSVNIPTDVIYSLIGLLEDKSPYVRRSATRALGNIWGHTQAGEAGKTAIPILVKLLADRNAEVRRNAPYTLWRIGPAAKVAIPVLKNTQNDPDEQVRKEVTDALYRLGGPEASATVPELIEILTRKQVRDGSGIRTERWKHGNIRRFEAAMYLGRRPRDEAKSAIPILKEILNDKDPAVRFHATVALCKLEPQSGPQVPGLTRALTEEEFVAQFWAAHALVEAVGKALPAWQVAAAYRSRLAIEALTKIKQVAVPALITTEEKEPWFWDIRESQILEFPARACPTKHIRRIDLKNFGLSSGAVEVLKRPGPDVVPFVIEYLTDDKEEVRRHAAAALGFIGPDASSSVDALIKTLEDPKMSVRLAASLSLVKIGSSAVPPLAKALSNDNDNVRRHAAAAIECIGTKNEAVVSALTLCLKDKDGMVCVNAARALLKLDSNRRNAVSVLIKALQQDDLYVIFNAAEALIQYGTNYTEAVLGLIEVCQKANYKNETGRTLGGDSVWTLKNVGPKAKEAIPVLIDALKPGDASWIYAVYAEALGNMGPEAEAAIPVLIEAAKSKSWRLRESAREALFKIQKSADTEQPD